MNRWVFGFLLLLTCPLSAAPRLFDLGSNTSAVGDGCTRVTPDSVFSPDTGFGWQTPGGLRAVTRAHTAMVENRSRGRDEPPPIWTNPLTEDAVWGDRPAVFLLEAPPGDVELYVLCGTSEAMSAQYFDFTVRVADQVQRVRFEGGYRFRALRFRARADGSPLAIHFSPRSKWVVSAIFAWAPAETERVQREIVTPLEEWTFNMPPEEWAKWQLEPEPASGSLPELTEADRQRGFVVYQRHYLECIYPQTKPRAEDLDLQLRLFATPGEYEPLSFVVHPLRDLSDARVVVSDLGPVAAADIDVRRVRFLRARPNYTVRYRYRMVPDVLEHFQSLDLPAGENARFWLTIRVPDDAPAGTFHGKVTFACSDGQLELPVTLRILPFRLREDRDKLFAIYYRHPYDQMARAGDDVSREYFRQRAEWEHADMVAHGTRNVVLSCGSSAADAEGNFRFDWQLLADKIALGQKHGFRGPLVMHISTGAIYAKHMRESYGSHLRGVQDPPQEFEQELTSLVRAIEAERQRRGWPEFLYYPVDEPSTDPTAVNFMLKVLRACKAAGVRTYVTADPTHEQFDPLRPYIDVWCTQPFAPDRETIQADMQARNVEYWCYPNHVNGENDHTPVTGARMTYGFGFWRSGFLTLIPWIYSSSTGDPFNYLDGPSMDFFNRHEPDGTPIPVAMWEAYREGYDDYRYVYTLEQVIAEAKRRPESAIQQAAGAAQRELQSVWDGIRVQTKYKYDGLWSPAEFDVYRWLVAQQILTLNAALGR
jgi:hypothetical protein